MNKEALQARLVEIEGALAQHDQVINQTVANKNALLGQQAEVKYWLAELEKAPELYVSSNIVDGLPLNNGAVHDHCVA